MTIMARSRIIGPDAGPAHRAMADGHDARDVAHYRQMLASEIGRPVFRPPAQASRESPRIGLMFAASLTAFCMVFGLKMWREGRLDFLKPPPPAVVDGRGANWMLGDRRRVPDDSITTPIASDAAVKAQPPLAPHRAEDADDPE